MPLWLWGIKSLDMALCMYGNMAALFIQDLDAGLDWTTILAHQVVGIVAMPLTSALVAVSTLSAILDVTAGFDVISK